MVRVRRIGLAVVALGAGAAGLMGASGPHDAELATLLRFMAVVKGTMAAAALMLSIMRFGAPIGNGLALAYAAGVAAMAAGSGLIWQLSHIGLGALLVHAGLAVLALLAWRDRDAAWSMIRVGPAARQTGRAQRRPAPSFKGLRCLDGNPDSSIPRLVAMPGQEPGS